MPFLEAITSYGHVWIIQAVVLFILFVAIISNWRKFVNFMTSNMIAVALTIWSVGVVVYVLGFSFEGTVRSFPALILRSMQAALGMFLSENELVEVSEHYKENAVYMTIFSVTHFSALFVSAILVFNTIGQRMKTSFRLLVESLRRKDKPTYVFWGVGAPSVSLATDIRRTNPDSRIIFFIESEEKSMGEKLEITQLIDPTNVHGSTENVRNLESVGSALLIYASVESIRQNSNKYSRIRRILSSTSKLTWFFMTDDDNENMYLAQAVASEKHITFRKEQAVDVYVLINDFIRNYAAEEKNLIRDAEENKVKLHYIDLPNMSVATLQHDAFKHPVTTFPASAISGGKIDGEFNAWVLGMGSTGCEMLRFFYEFGSFIGMDGKPAGKHISLFDSEFSNTVERMFRTCPHILESGHVDRPEPEIGSLEFWDMVTRNADKLNCIAVCLRDDEKCISITRELYRQLLQHKSKGAPRTRIYIRIYSHQNEKTIKEFAQDYSSDIVDIVPFGGLTDIFNTKIILKMDVADSLLEFNYRFDKIRNRNVGMSAKECLAADFSIKKYLNRYGDMVMAVDEIARRAMQVQSEAYHAGTLMLLAGVAKGDFTKIRALAEITAQRPADHLGYVCDDPELAQMLEILVQTSYLRQKALHEILGFSPCDLSVIEVDHNDAVRKKLTPYVLDWEECPDKFKKVYYEVVDTSFDLVKDIVATHN